MNDKKNVITPFAHHSFTFLKIRFTLTDSGKVVRKLSRNSVHAMRRKQYIFRKWVDDGRMQAEDAIQSYQSWRAHAKRCNSYDTLRGMDARFITLFGDELKVRKKKFKCTYRATKTPDGWVYHIEREKKGNDG